MLRWIALLLLPAFAAGAHAADDTELQRLNTLLNVLNQEQRSIVQQLQITQDMRRSNSQSLCDGHLMPPGVVDYADWVAAQRDAMRRDEELRSQSDRLYARWQELESNKKPVLQRMYELASPKQ